MDPCRYILSKKIQYVLGFKAKASDIFVGDDHFPVYSCSFGKTSSTSHLLALAFENGKIIVQDTKSSSSENLQVDNAHKNAIFDLIWVPNETQLVSASADSTISHWNVNNGTLTLTQKFDHSKSVKSIDVNQWDPKVFASGGRDGNIIIWDIRCKPTHKANKILGAHTPQYIGSSPAHNRTNDNQIHNTVSCVLFSQQHNLLSAGSSDGLLKIWDLRKTYGTNRREALSTNVLEYDGQSSCRGYTSLSLSPRGERVYVSCLDSNIYAYHIVNPTSKPVAVYSGHRANSYFIKSCLSSCGSYLLSGSSDENAYVWLTEAPGLPIVKLIGHRDEVTCVAWSSDAKEKVVTCADDLSVRTFRLSFSDKDNLNLEADIKSYAVPYDSDQSSLSKRKNLSIGTSNVYSHLHYLNGIVKMKRKCTSNLLTNTNLSTNGQLHVPQPESASPQNICLNSSPLTAKFPNTLQKTPQQQSKSIKTPKTSGRKTLLGWLSSTKSQRDDLECTPLSSVKKSPINSLEYTPTLSSVKSSKRKLSVIYENQENLEDEGSKDALSPTENILSDQNIKRSSSFSSAAKMLKYDDAESSTRLKKRSLNAIDELDESVKPLDDKSGTISYNFNSNPSQLYETPIKESQNSRSRAGSASKLKSPTVNLPNFVIDGRSPHSRPEPRVEKKHSNDWLTLFSLRKKINRTLDTIPEDKTVNGVKRTRKVLQIKKKKIM